MTASRTASDEPPVVKNVRAEKLVASRGFATA